MKQKQDKIKETKYKNGKNNKSAVSGVYTKNKQTKTRSQRRLEIRAFCPPELTKK